MGFFTGIFGVYAGWKGLPFINFPIVVLLLVLVAFEGGHSLLPPRVRDAARGVGCDVRGRIRGVEAAFRRKRRKRREKLGKAVTEPPAGSTLKRMAFFT